MALHSFLKTDPRPVRPEVQFAEEKKKYISVINLPFQHRVATRQLSDNETGITDPSSVRGMISSLLYDLGHSIHVRQEKLAKFTHDAIRMAYCPCDSIRKEAEENSSLELEMEIHLVQQIAQSIFSDKTDVAPFTEFYKKIYPNDENPRIFHNWGRENWPLKAFSNFKT